MSDPQSGRKRQRTVSHTAKDNASGSAAKLLVKQDDEFWFEDGNIVLIARDIEFCVFKGILAKHSPLFRDMFSLPPPSRPLGSLQSHAAVADTCSTVHLSDSPEDFGHILRVCMPETNLT